MHDFHEPHWSDDWDRPDLETQRIADHVVGNGCRVRWKGRNYPARVFRANDRFARQILDDTTVILFGHDSREIKRFTRAEFIAQYLTPRPPTRP